MLFDVLPIALLRCCVMSISLGLNIALHPEEMADGSSVMTTTAIDQNQGECNIVQPAISNRVSAIGTVLRLRLSNIFQRDNAEMEFFFNVPSAPGTTGKNQLAICQSPRIQR